MHPYHRNDALLAWCAAHDVHVTAFSPLGSPDSESIFPRKKPLVLMQDATVQASAPRHPPECCTVECTFAAGQEQARGCAWGREGAPRRPQLGGLHTAAPLAWFARNHLSAACRAWRPYCLQAVARRSGKNVGQVLIRWALQHGTSVIPKSTSPARIRWMACYVRGERNLAGCLRMGAAPWLAGVTPPYGVWGLLKLIYIPAS